MGGLCTSCRPQVPKDEDSSIKKHGSWLRRKTSISAAFSFGSSPHKDTESESALDEPTAAVSPCATLDINTAGEEDLMTLPQVGRVIAHNIVQYRKKIGGFQRIEDLALVSGIGASKLEKLRKEIHVSMPKPRKSSDSTSNSTVVLPLNINKATVAQLSALDEINVDLAEKIVQYRKLNGPFQRTTDLVDPAGLIDTPALLKLKYSLSVGNSTSGHSRSASNCSSRLINTYPFTGPESFSSSRPRIEAASHHCNNRPVVRIATWNLQQFSKEKAQNPGVKEVVCMTLLENGIKVLVAQELAHQDALMLIANELNSPTLPNVQRFKGSRGPWKCAVSSTAAGQMYQASEYNGFLWDASASITLYSHSLLEKPASGKEFVRRPFLGYFKVDQFDVVLASVHLKAVGHVNTEGDIGKLTREIKLLPQFVKALQAQIPEEKDLLVLGDFNLEPDENYFDVLRDKMFEPVVPATTPTNISTNNMKGSRCYDNIWLSATAAKSFSGAWQVVRTGLTSPWIPDGWSWGGVVSDHCPVWAEFFVDRDADPEAVNKDVSGLTLNIG